MGRHSKGMPKTHAACCDPVDLQVGGLASHPTVCSSRQHRCHVWSEFAAARTGKASEAVRDPWEVSGCLRVSRHVQANVEGGGSSTGRTSTARETAARDGLRQLCVRSASGRPRCSRRPVHGMEGSDPYTTALPGLTATVQS